MNGLLGSGYIRFGVARRLILGLIAGLLSASSVRADNSQVGQSETLGSFRAKFSGSGAQVLPERAVKAASVQLGAGSELTLSAPKSLESAAQTIQAEISNLHHDYDIIFGSIPPVKAKIKLMTEEDFFVSTGAPSWTNAMYYRGEILIPVANTPRIDLQNLRRAARHEYSHALVHALSGGRCPGWLDEGLAQWAEGEENAALAPALKKWLKANSPVSLSLLQGGFTKLKSDMVPAAYAQSLFAARSIIKTFGFGAIKDYFFELRAGKTPGPKLGEEAFARAFSVSQVAFESRLRNAVAAWGLGRQLSHSHDEHEL